MIMGRRRYSFPAADYFGCTDAVAMENSQRPSASPGKTCLQQNLPSPARSR